MVDRFYGFDILRNQWSFNSQIFHKGSFFLPWTHDENLLSIFQNSRDIAIEGSVVVFIGVRISVVLLRVWMRRMRFQGLGLRGVFIEMNDLGLGVIEPYNCVIEGHSLLSAYRVNSNIEQAHSRHFCSLRVGTVLHSHS